MHWKIVKIPNESKGRTSPYASVGFGRLSLSVAACELIDNFHKYTHVQLLQAKSNNRPYVGIRFLTEASTDSIKISRKKVNGNFVGGVDISNSKVLENLFGLAATAKKATRYNVRKDNTFNEFLVITLE